MNWVSPIKDEKTLMEFEERLRKVDDKYYIMFIIGIETGMLLQDILQLKVKDILGKDVIKAEIGTKKIQREYKVTEEVKKIISEYCKNKKANDYVIIGHASSNQPVSREQAYRVLKTVGREMGLSSIGAQTMRKTFAWRYYKNTGDIYYIQYILNHASPSITYRYIGEKPNIEIVLKKMSAEENERSRYMLYQNNNGVNRLNDIIAELTDIKENFSNPMNSDAFYGRVDCLLVELEEIMAAYKQR